MFAIEFSLLLYVGYIRLKFAVIHKFAMNEMLLYNSNFFIANTPSQKDEYVKGEETNVCSHEHPHKQHGKINKLLH